MKANLTNKHFSLPNPGIPEPQGIAELWKPNGKTTPGTRPGTCRKRRKTRAHLLSNPQLSPRSSPSRPQLVDPTHPPLLRRKNHPCKVPAIKGGPESQPVDHGYDFPRPFPASCIVRECRRGWIVPWIQRLGRRMHHLARSSTMILGC